MGAGKSVPSGTVDQLNVALIKMAISTLPFVLLKTHVYMMAKEVVARTNTTTLKVVSTFQGVKNRGRCHSAQRGPRIRDPTREDRAATAAGAEQNRASQALRPALLLGKIRKQRHRARTKGPGHQALETIPGHPV